MRSLDAEAAVLRMLAEATDPAKEEIATVGIRHSKNECLRADA